MKFENTEVTGFENAILGARLPMCKDLEEAKKKSDSFKCSVNQEGNCLECPYYIDNHMLSGDECIKDNEGYFEYNDSLFVIGKKDLDLLKRLIKADDKIGQPNSKFLRMIHAQVCITAPLYWWKEMDTYKVGTTANSTSTMHRIANYPITEDCFEMDDFENITFDNRVDYDETLHIWTVFIDKLESLRLKYNETKDKRYWKELIRLLPESWLQTRMFDCDYATLRNIYCWRKNHKLTEWHSFCKWVESLPYAQELIIN